MLLTKPVSKGQLAAAIKAGVEYYHLAVTDNQGLLNTINGLLTECRKADGIQENLDQQRGTTKFLAGLLNTMVGLNHGYEAEQEYLYDRQTLVEEIGEITALSNKEYNMLLRANSLEMVGWGLGQDDMPTEACLDRHLQAGLLSIQEILACRRATYMNLFPKEVRKIARLLQIIHHVSSERVHEQQLLNRLRLLGSTSRDLLLIDCGLVSTCREILKRHDPKE